jgi:hypothetical protein
LFVLLLQQYLFHDLNIINSKKEEKLRSERDSFLKTKKSLGKYAESEPGFQARNDRDDKRPNKSNMDWSFVQKLRTTKLEEEVGIYLA